MLNMIFCNSIASPIFNSKRTIGIPNTTNSTHFKYRFKALENIDLKSSDVKVKRIKDDKPSNSSYALFSSIR